MINQPVRENIHDFITADPAVQFFIPIYQKNYTWKPEEETARFMNDAESILKHPRRHFLGLFIYRPVVTQMGQKQYEIVDGQQRLTTIYLYLLVLYQEAKAARSRELAEEIMKTCLSQDGTAVTMRFQPAISLQQVYYKLLNQSLDILTWQERQSLIYQNYVYIRQYVHMLAGKYSLEDLFHVLNRMEIIAFPLEKDDDTQQIFESINLAGSYMTFSDRLRDFIFMNCSEQEQTMLYQMYWQPLEQIFPDPDQMSFFVRTYLALKTGSLLDRGKIYDGFKVFWNRINDPYSRKLSDLYAYALSYQMVYTGPADAAEVEEALQDYRVASYKEPAALLMDVIHRFRTGTLSTKETVQIIRLVDTYMTRRAMLNLDNKNLAGWFPGVARSLRSHTGGKEGEMYDAIRDALLTSSRSDFPHGMPSDKQIRNAVRTMNMYSSPRTARVLLERLEKSSSSVGIDMSHLNIEHIMPVHPTAYWRQTSRCQDDGEYSMYANLLGNLTLADQDDNMEMGNESFDRKKKVLAQTSHIHLNADVLKQDSWNKKTILQRCDAMAEQLLKIFPYPQAVNSRPEKKVQPAEQTAPKENDPEAMTPVPHTRLFHDHDGVYAKVMSVKSGQRAIMPGSRIKVYGDGSMKHNRRLYEQWKENGAIEETDDGYVLVLAPLPFDGLKDAASFVTQTGGSQKDVWHITNRTEDGLNYWQGLGEKDLEPHKSSSPKSSEKAAVQAEKGTAEPSAENLPAEEEKNTSAAAEKSAEKETVAAAAEEKPSSSVDEMSAPAEESAAASDATEKEQPEAVTEDKPADAEQIEAATEKPADAEQADAMAAEPAEPEQPAPAKAAAEEVPQADASAEEMPEEEKKPAKKKRKTAKKASEKEEEPEKKPARKRRTSTKKKAEEAPEESAESAEEAEKKPARRRRTAVKKTAEDAEKSGEDTEKTAKKTVKKSRKKAEKKAEPVAEEKEAAAEPVPEDSVQNTEPEESAAAEATAEKPAAKKTARRRKTADQKESEEQPEAEAVTEIEDALKEDSNMEEEKKNKKTDKKTVKKTAASTEKKSAGKKAADKTAKKPAKKTAAGKKASEETEKKPVKKAAAKKKTADEAGKKTVKKTAEKTEGKKTAAKKKTAAGTSKKTSAKATAKKAASRKKAAGKTLSKKRNNRPGLRMKPQSNHSRSASQRVKVVTFAGQSR